MNRRTLLKYVAINALTFPYILNANIQKQHKNLILIELKGGNDGLNTLIPYSNPLYYKYRPNIAISKDKVLKINNQVGLHPSMEQIKSMFDKGEVAIHQGIGYENPNRSHFRSIEIWDTASKSDEYLNDGWLKSYSNSNDEPIKGVVLGGTYGPLSGFDKGVIKIENVNSFIKKSRQIKDEKFLPTSNKSLNHILKTQLEIKQSAHSLSKKVQKTKRLKHKFEKNNFAKQMQIATSLINAKMNIPFYKVSLGSFDTHINQLNPHANLLKQLSHTIDIMRKNLIESGEWENTTIMTYSEFGRRVKENASKGTDHGTAAPHFIIGGNIKGGVYGNHPSLEKLDYNDLIYETDLGKYYESVQNSIVLN